MKELNSLQQDVFNRIGDYNLSLSDLDYIKFRYLVDLLRSFLLKQPNNRYLFHPNIDIEYQEAIDENIVAVQYNTQDQEIHVFHGWDDDLEDTWKDDLILDPDKLPNADEGFLLSFTEGLYKEIMSHS